MLLLVTKLWTLFFKTGLVVIRKKRLRVFGDVPTESFVFSMRRIGGAGMA